MILLVSVSGNRIGYRAEYMVLGSTHPHIFLCYGLFSSLNMKYVYNKVSFYGGELEDDFS